MELEENRNGHNLATNDEFSYRVVPNTGANNNHHVAPGENHHDDPIPGGDDGIEERGEGEGFSFDLVTGDVVFQRRVLPKDANSCSLAVSRLQTHLANAYTKHKGTIWKVMGVLLLIGYLVYVICSLVQRGVQSEEQTRLLVFTIIGIVMLCVHLARKKLNPLYRTVDNFRTCPQYTSMRYWIRWGLYILSTVLTVTLIIALVAIETPRNLLSLAGLSGFILVCYVTSYNPAMINWHPVFWGFSLQFYFAVIILKTRWGYDAFDWLGARVTEFLLHSDAGAMFVFGDLGFFNFQDGTTFNIKSAESSDGTDLNLAKLTLADESSVVFTSVYKIHFIAFKVLPVVIFFCAFISIMTYLGVMEFVIKNMGRFLSFCLGTTPAESLSAAGNIFVGMAETPLMIRPYLSKMTSSELHAVMTGGFATIAGTVLGVYIGFGVPAEHVLSASVMSAPAALAISKITYPEIEVPVLKAQDYGEMNKSTETNMLQAACNGALISGKVCAAILVNIIAFLSLLHFVNATLTWFGARIGIEELTFELICSYVLYPVALFMGVDTADCRKVAELIGIKTFTNEFIAFDKLSMWMKNREAFEKYVSASSNNTWHTTDGDDIVLHALDNRTLHRGMLERRTEVIATYALCGFSNFGSMGILLGGLSALAPTRIPTMSKLIVRSMIAGNIACFFTACVAGLFYEEFK